MQGSDLRFFSFPDIAAEVPLKKVSDSNLQSAPKVVLACYAC